jgi:tryptophanyl-tRNA synthetase
MTTAVSGIKPTGALHLGNYLGMIRPALALAERCERSFYFIADYHALNTLRDPNRLAALTLDAAASLLALGLDTRRTVLYRQSDLPETFELATILATVTPKGALNRAHAYKAAVSANREAGRPADEGVNLGLYTYPTLMAADILVTGAELVPVGRDQAQHVEITRQVARGFNEVFGQTLPLPRADIDPRVEVIPGLDGRKMSKSYGNTIALFAPELELRRQVARIKTDSRPPEEPKDPEASIVQHLFRHFGSAAEAEASRDLHAAGGLSYAEAKEALVQAIERQLGEGRRKFLALREDRAALAEILEGGAREAQAAARLTLSEVRSAVGAAPVGRR